MVPECPVIHAVLTQPNAPSPPSRALVSAGLPAASEAGSNFHNWSLRSVDPLASIRQPGAPRGAAAAAAARKNARALISPSLLSSVA